MADYEKMYALLCGTVDEVIDSLEKIPQAHGEAEKLRNALLNAEKIYAETTVADYYIPKKSKFYSL